MDRLEKEARPPDAATVVVPDSVPPPGLVPIATVMLALALVTVLPNESCTATCTGGLAPTPAAAAEGWTVNPTLTAAAAVMLKVALVAVARTGAELAVR